MPAIGWIHPWACSTPFGIKARITLHVDRLPRAVLWCSTPFGIKARITHASRNPGRRWPVLNAFRHQGKNHTGNPRRRSGQGDRQVLNAFRHQGKNHTHPAARSSSARCAQRLSASRQESRIRRTRSTTHANCAQRLSASRQESRRARAAARTAARPCSTPFGIKARITNSMTCGALPPARRVCSTPFGIKARITDLNL